MSAHGQEEGHCRDRGGPARCCHSKGSCKCFGPHKLLSMTFSAHNFVVPGSSHKPCISYRRLYALHAHYNVLVVHVPSYTMFVMTLLCATYHPGFLSPCLICKVACQYVSSLWRTRRQVDCNADGTAAPTVCLKAMSCLLSSLRSLVMAFTEASCFGSPQEH